MRKVSVGLEADVAAFIRPVGEATKSVDGLDRKVDGLDRSINKIPPDAAKAGAAMKLLGGDAHGISKQFDDFGVGATNSLKLIDKKIEDTRANVKRFAEDFNRNGNLTSFDLWRAASKDLGGLERIKKQLTTALSDGAKDAGRSAGPSFMAALGIAAVGSAPWLASVLGAAVVGGGGLGLIGLGIIGQAKNPAVRDAFSGLGLFAQQALTGATSAFGPALVKGADMLTAALGRMSPKLQVIFDRLAPVLDKLLGGGIGFFDRMLPGLDALSRAAGPVLGALADSLPRLGGALAKMLQDISAGAPGAANGLSALVTVVDGLLIVIGKLIRGFEMLPGPVQAGVAIVGVLTAAVMLLAPKVLVARDAIVELGNGSLAADTKLGGLARSAGMVALALGAVQVASAAFGHNATTGIDATTKSLNELWLTGQKTSAATKHLDYDLGTLGTGGMAKTGNAIAGFTEGLTGLGSVMDESLQHAQERIASIDAAMAAEVQNGNAAQAADQFQALADAAAKQGVSIDDVRKGLPQYADALAAAAAANEKAGATAMMAAGGAVEFGRAIDDLRNKQLSAANATLALKEGWFTLQKELDHGKKTLKDNSEEGLANQKAILAQVDAAERARAQTLALTGSQVEANKVYNDATERIRAAAKAAGFNADEVDRLINSVSGLPETKTVQVNTPGLGTALDQGISLGNALNNISGTYTAHVNVAVSAPSGISVGNLMHRAGGGPVAAGTPYVVGDGGQPEVFVPDVSGTIVPSISRYAQMRGGDMRATGYAASGGGGGGGGMPSHITLEATFLDPHTGDVMRQQAITWSINRGRNPADFFTRA